MQKNKTALAVPVFMETANAAYIWNFLIVSHAKQLAEYAAQTFRASPNDNFHKSESSFYKRMMITPAAISPKPHSHLAARHGSSPPIHTPMPNAAMAVPISFPMQTIPYHAPDTSIGSKALFGDNAQENFIIWFYRMPVLPCPPRSSLPKTGTSRNRSAG